MLHHRTNVRAQTDVPVDVHADGFVFSCRAVDVSTTGALIDRAPGLEHHEARPFYWLRFGVGAHGVMTLARPVWKRGLTQAFRFVEMSDEGRLTLAEHMDVAHRLFGRALHLIREVSSRSAFDARRRSGSYVERATRSGIREANSTEGHGAKRSERRDRRKSPD